MEEALKGVFWNVYEVGNSDIVSSLVNQYKPDFVGFSEYKDPIDAIFNKLVTLGFKKCEFKGNKMCAIFIRQDFQYLTTENEKENKRISPLVITKNEHRFLAIGVHFSSKLYNGEKEIFIEQQLIGKEIRRIQKQLDIDKLIVFGDFNMDPYDSNLLYKETLCALPSYLEAERHNALYNPMWNFLGDNDGFLAHKGKVKNPGTYFYQVSKNRKHRWHFFDQVIFSPNLRDSFDFDSFEIVTEVGSVSLASLPIGKPLKDKQNGYPDHFPIYFKFKLS
jgi:hypothetical protein